MKENKEKRTVEQAHNGQSTTNLYPANIREVDSRLKGSKGVVWWWGEIVYFGFSAIVSFGKMPYWDDILPKRGS